MQEPSIDNIKVLVDNYNKNSNQERENRLFNEIGKCIKNRGYIQKEEFLEIVRWKSARAIRKAEANNKEVVKKITKIALETDDEEIRMMVITSLNGVSIPMVSAIFTVSYPEKYGVIDIRGWHTLYNLKIVDYKKDVFNIKDWLLYLEIIRKLSKKYEVSPRDIDKAIFMYDKINRKGNLYRN